MGHFETMDTNQDGVLRLAEMQGGSSARTPTQNHQTKLHGQMDRNQDGVVAKEEFLAFWKAYFQAGDKDQDGVLSGAEVSAMALAQADTNGDGKVSFAEDQAMRRVHFNSLDKNGDGRVTLQEMQGNAPSPKTVMGERDFSAELAAFEALAGLTDAPAVWSAESADATESLAAIYYDALEWKGKPTKVYAWLGLPKNVKGKVPGVVLVHGGGGTAYKEWVERWNERGYAAISIAVEGQTDVKDNSASRHSPWERHEWAGPQRSGIYHDSKLPFEEQWMYHAVADTILANSLLRSFPEVDSERIGIMGISWGGVITSTVIGIDPRFAFAIPVYGCGSLATAPNQYGKSLGSNALYQQVYDPALRLNRASVPTLWLSWAGESHFPLDAQQRSYALQPGQYMVSLVPDMGHGHGSGWIRPESYAFADSVLNGDMWCRQLSSYLQGPALRVDFTATKPITQATLWWTRDTGATGEREWHSLPATVSRRQGNWVAKASLPDEATACFVNVESGRLIATSDYMELK